jgi:hypothetical protein
MFTFFGLFADPVSGLSEQVSQAWPSLNVIRIEQPISAVAARFDENSYEHDIEQKPEHTVQAVEKLSKDCPAARFLLLRAECWGGVCEYWGQIIQDGQTVIEAEGNQSALRRLIEHWGVDLGPNAIFDPLQREFPWSRSVA